MASPAPVIAPCKWLSSCGCRSRMSKSSQAASPVISSDSEALILVDENDAELGSLPKRECHLGQGVLHRAFSIFIFNQAGDVLLQKRSDQKFLWGGCWSNACCSHPRQGESSEDAARRRLEQELGITPALTFLYKFTYQASWKDIGSEHELCWVWAGQAEAAEISANHNEIADWRFYTQAELANCLREHPDDYTPWMKMEWERICRYHAEVIPG